MSGISPAPFGILPAVFNNAVPLQSEDNAGVVRNLIFLGAGNNILLGSSSNPLFVVGAGFAQKNLRYFSSSAQTITLSSALTLAHGLGVVPFKLWGWLECVTTELGWAAGDTVLMPRGDAGNTRSIWLGADATNITVSYPTAAPQLNTKNGTSSGTITPTNWRLYVGAET